MERWLLTFFIGALCALVMPVTPTPYYVTLFAIVAMLFIATKCMKVYSGFFIGLAWLLFNGWTYNNIWLANNIVEGDFFTQSHQLVGTVVSLGTINSLDLTKPSQKFNFLVEQINNQTLKRPILLRLNWHQTQQLKHATATTNPSSSFPLIKQGQYWQLIAKFKPAYGLANPGGFNYQAWLRQKNIHGTGYVKKHNGNRLLNNSRSHRQQLFDEMHGKLPKHELVAFIYALTFGERFSISNGQWQVLTATGTQHLIAISGLHLGLVAAAAFYFFNIFCRFVPLTQIPNNRLKAVLSCQNIRLYSVLFSCLIAIFYAYLAGFSLPTVRALIMLLLYWCCRLANIQLKLSLWLLMVVFFIVLFDPLSITSASFWLSLYAVTVIFLLLWRLSFTRSKQHFLLLWLKNLVLIQLGLTLFMLPIVAIYAQQISLMAFFANIVAVPLMSFTAIPLALLFLITSQLNTWLGDVVLELTLYALQLVWYWLEWLAHQPWALITLSQSQTLALTLVVMSIVICWLLNLSVQKQILASSAVVAIALAAQKVYLNEQPSWQLSVMDVGQGLAVVIEKQQQAILYDTGASYPSGFNMADTVLLPYFQSKGINTLDRVMISHKDNDHAGSLPMLKQGIDVGFVMANANKLSANSLCAQQESFRWQGLSFDILWPEKKHNEEQKSNDRSCVVKLSDGNFTALLSGDISKSVEAKLIAENLLTDIDVLVVPHHGSHTSSSAAFLTALTPEVALVSAGFMNQWQMPKKSVVQRYHSQGIELLSTIEQGMITVSIYDDSHKISSYRQQLWPFWFAN
ncbi:DNA internalization-related competence protein ComEC/Rec2 [Thalassotalea sp. PLHSN55]|uniref:DNA internalization-related competence protein ComEC/Rec2 n=1 Tax=Thalassotalea sp. PLHSN55 TaxID=3435888 RepID=UPI003F87F594